ncbi:MAG: hypothetical protein SCALA702_28250 [Melioribacteraceae bacterium]|nr:MAG: hypothetical protein SCALA702_28250 [Melioribacteraceae bacterium]
MYYNDDKTLSFGLIEKYINDKCNEDEIELVERFKELEENKERFEIVKNNEYKFYETHFNQINEKIKKLDIIPVKIEEKQAPEIRRGQIWRLKSEFQNFVTGKNFLIAQPRFALVISNGYQSSFDSESELNDSYQLYDIVPLSFHCEYATNHDLLFDKSYLGESFMVQTELDVPVCDFHLDKFVTEISEEDLEKVYKLQDAQFDGEIEISNISTGDVLEEEFGERVEFKKGEIEFIINVQEAVYSIFNTPLVDLSALEITEEVLAMASSPGYDSQSSPEYEEVILNYEDYNYNLKIIVHDRRVYMMITEDLYNHVNFERIRVFNSSEKNIYYFRNIKVTDCIFVSHLKDIKKYNGELIGFEVTADGKKRIGYMRLRV